MNKKGQVFLMAALIIAGIVISLVRISNQSAARDEPEAFFDLSDEISFETKRVLDYGVINSAANVSDLASQLLAKYSENIAGHDVAFIYGNKDGNIYAYYYRQVNVVAITLLDGFFQELTVVSGGQIEAMRSTGGDTATIKIDDLYYTFELKEGQNFYFVIVRNEDGEKFVTVE